MKLNSNTFAVAVRLPPLWMSLNGRKDYHETKVIRDGLIQDAMFATRQALEPMPEMRRLAGYRVTWTFVVPDKRRRDPSNMVAACKYLEDGMALALGVDDSTFRPGGVRMVVRPGRRYAIATVEYEAPGTNDEAEFLVDALRLPPNVTAATQAMDSWGKRRRPGRVADRLPGR